MHCGGLLPQVSGTQSLQNMSDLLMSQQWQVWSGRVAAVTVM